MANESKSGVRIGFTGLLLLIFITLKLTKTIDWSWWWVLSPIWIIAAIVVIAIVVAVWIDMSTSKTMPDPPNPKKSAFQSRMHEAQRNRTNI
jgi:hypothetical protein